MILPEKNNLNDSSDTKAPLTDPNDRSEALASLPSSSSRAIAPPTFPTPFENAPPPSYDFTGPATSATSSYYAPASSATVEAMSAPRVPGSLPVSFNRAPAGSMTYPSFQPMFLVAHGKTLDKGFPIASPPSNSRPHPFVSHDVNEGDWMRYLFTNNDLIIMIDRGEILSFLNDARMAATLTDKQIWRSHLPIVSIIPIVSESRQKQCNHSILLKEVLI